MSSSHSITPNILLDEATHNHFVGRRIEGSVCQNSTNNLNSDGNGLVVEKIRCWLDFLGVVGKIPAYLILEHTAAAR